jgi:hypothetical protein
VSTEFVRRRIRKNLEEYHTERKARHRALLADAGVVARDRVTLFFPRRVEEQFLDLERRYPGKAPKNVCRTRFQILPDGRSYRIEVVGQSGIE